MNIKRFYLIGFFIILALPALTTALLFNPPAWGKTIVFRIILSILIFVFIYQILYKKTGIKFSIVRNLLPFWILIALWGIFLLATIFSLDPYYSFWESPLRAGGFLNFSFYIIFAILAFLFIRKKDWQKIWAFTISIGIFASIIAILQQYNIFKEVIIPYAGRPPSTMGGPLFLALYLLLLVFITFSFLLKEKERKKKIFYFLALLLFLYVILLTGSRAAYFGLFIGFFYFIFAWQKSFFLPKKKGLLVGLKILFLLFLIISTYGIYYLNTQPKLPNYLQENKILQQILPRLSISQVLINPRFSAWEISLEAIKARPILGYGPENFSIAFDKNYNPSLPYISKTWGSWYDKAHNFLFDISVTAGIPALIIYLSLFAALFWGLQKVKEKQIEESLISHGIQATFFGYLAANLFSFDVFSTYLILFLIIGYSLSLISKLQKPLIVEKTDLVKKEEQKEIKPAKPVFLSILFLVLIWFIWSFNLRPLSINKEINWADYYVKTNQCEKALQKMETNVLPSQSIINSYAKLKYIDIIGKCSTKMPELKSASAPKAISVLKEAAKIRPYYTRTWIFLGSYTNFLIENKKYFKIENVEELKKQAYSYFGKALQLSPKREQIFISWTQTDLILKEYQKAREKAEQCIKFNPESSYCWWVKGLSNLYLDNVGQGVKDIEMAIERKFNVYSEKYVSQFNIACEKTKNTKCFGKLADIYYTIALNHPPTPEYFLRSIYISAIGEKEELLKKHTRIMLTNWPELESELKNTLESAHEYTNKIDMEMVNQYINEIKKLIEIQTNLKNLVESELESETYLWFKYEYKNKTNAIDKIIMQIKLIKND